ncbi:hypothetical protein A1O3_05255 [Capronia epimyces CBS 606.96]|uniref:Hemerythrin-like domain-containing protein n=1 Tax=Capronia epimyces CBS 606.96 TaxID=1182542 RepID=W9Y4L3_9EURO|nr:uncharacterized protein A1O3_05255 [Capronia epimyces CBS 606.96]EXJ84585.1 hypothetical protein A1O3_05255 [Capronia epimyces CBS 606.96]
MASGAYLDTQAQTQAQAQATTPPPLSSGSGDSESAVPAPPPPPTEAPDAESAKLSVADFGVFNRLAVMMDAYDARTYIHVHGSIDSSISVFIDFYFCYISISISISINISINHNHFRSTWNLLYKACTDSSRPAGMSIRSFVSQGLRLSRALTMHHTIEEQHIFPELAERMPAFAPHEHLITQHEQIHEGLERFDAYLDACASGERELRLSELKEIMDSFAHVLWAHLDDEVRMLGAENMRKYWSKDEILSMNW